VADTRIADNAEFKIDPVVLLEKWGIDNFSLNTEGLIIYLPDLEFKKAAFQIGTNIKDITTAFYAFG